MRQEQRLNRSQTSICGLSACLTAYTFRHPPSFPDQRPNLLTAIVAMMKMKIIAIRMVIATQRFYKLLYPWWEWCFNFAACLKGLQCKFATWRCFGEGLEVLWWRFGGVLVKDLRCFGVLVKARWRGTTSLVISAEKLPSYGFTLTITARDDDGDYDYDYRDDDDDDVEILMTMMQVRWWQCWPPEHNNANYSSQAGNQQRHMASSPWPPRSKCHKKGSC